MRRPNPVLFAFALALPASMAVAQSSENGIRPMLTGLAEQAEGTLAGTSFNVGVAYSQSTYKVRRSGQRTQLTDNGALGAVFEVVGNEKSLISWPMQVGKIVIGWNLKVTGSLFETRYELVNSALRGEDTGTTASGGFVGVAPSLFLKLGPLFPHSEIYWKLGYGVGPGALKSSGAGQFGAGGSIQSVGSSSPRLALYQDAALQLQVERWQFEFNGKTLTYGTDEPTSLETYGFGVAYRIAF